MTPDDVQGVIVTEPPNLPHVPDREVSTSMEPPAAGTSSRAESEADERRYREQDARSGDDRAPDRTARVYVGLWLPAAGALLAYAIMRGNYWAAFIGAELLLVGWFTLGKL